MNLFRLQSDLPFYNAYILRRRSENLVYAGGDECLVGVSTAARAVLASGSGSGFQTTTATAGSTYSGQHSHRSST